MATDGRTTEFFGDSGSQHDRLHRLGKYEIKRRLGAGGMGTVFLAVDTKLNRTVALKVLPKERAENPTLVKRFKMEAQAAAQLEHRNIVRVYEAGEADGFLYIALEYVEGIDVHELVAKRGVLPVRRSIDIVRQIARALEHAASKQIVHRDIKPANLMIKRDGTVKLADMGLARSIDESTPTNITRAGMTVGTVDYMAPEQARSSQAADVRSDLYSLGCSWYHMLTGEPPFPHGSLTEKLQAHASGKRPDPRAENAAVPEAVVAVMHRMMARDPAHRYQTPQELLADLDLASRSLNSLNATGLEALVEESGAARHKVRSRSDSGPTALPPKEAFRPVDLTAGRAIDIDVLRFGIPAVIVLVVVGVLLWAVRRGGDLQGGGAGGIGAHAFPGNDPAVDQDPTPVEADPSGVVQQGAEADSLESTPFDGHNAAPQVVEHPFPGAEDASTTTDGAALIPDWVNKFRTRVTPPAQVLVVSRRAEGHNQYRRLQDALSALPREGGTVELDGDGPFHLEPASITARGLVQLRAAEGRSPVVYLTAGSAPIPAEGFLVVRTPELEIDNLHFVMVDAVEEEVALLRIASGELSLRDCSITVAEGGSHSATAIVMGEASQPSVRASRPPGSMGRCLLENVVIRGNRLTAVQFSGESGELVAGNSLLSSGDAPAFVLRDQGGSERSIRLLASTVISQGVAFEFSHTGDQSPSACDIITRNSLIACAAPPGESATMVELRGWPEQRTSVGVSRVAPVEWSSEGSAFSNWSFLAALFFGEGEELERVETADEWRRFWDRALADKAVKSLALPEVARRNPAQITPRGMGPGEESEESRVGCDPNRFADAPWGLIEHVIVASRAPTPPADSGETLSVNESPITFDLMKRSSLGNFLQSDACPSGAHVIATGSGLRKVDRLVIADKSIRLEFRQTGSQPLVIQTNEGSGNAVRAAITVRNANLDLIGGRFQVPASAKGRSFPWLMEIDRAHVAMRKCTFEGPSQASPEHSGLIHFVDEGEEPVENPSHILMEDCFLKSPGQLIAGAVRFDSLILRNSILASQSEAIAIELDEEGLRRGASVVINHCTIAAGRALFEFPGVAPSAVDVPPLELIVSESVFLSIPHTGNSVTAVVVCGSEEIIERGLRWWGTLNGFAATLTHFVVTGAEPSASGFHSWLHAWGDGHEVNPLNGPTDVIFAAPLPEWTSIQPMHFELNPTAPAATAGREGAALGANIAEIGSSHAGDEPGKKTPGKSGAPRGVPPDRPRNRDLF